ncbi:23S rRNA (guanosine(2251)-2'-O)-methyltransferase RlmB [Raineya orbicola]|uniref:RNA methyltransferase, TrmH family, group 3 n=1 Tax=Raineya orbicola TaxID=2016530 RepID=A0A2N3I2U6_9BACT|nr:23S rRNA (guanosine(2251)-2'-O)-methyltransferase RlmB [Raineya orbicola]PKQ64622.1 RNA methyltransferase, TrmH family, group 3 [Raineya orbicola]
MQKNNSPKDFIFGIRAIIEALRAGKEIDKLLIQQDLGKSVLMGELLELAKIHQIPTQRVPIFKLNKITAKNHQGAIAFLSQIDYVSFENILQSTFEKGETPLFLLLDSITDVRNLGAIARSAEGLGVHCLIVPEKNSAQINSDAIKTSAGALHHLPVARVKSLLQAVKYLQEAGLQVVACTEKATQNIYEIDFSIPTALVMGAEDTGIATPILKQCDKLAKIPMQGKVDSLNVSVSAGIVLYEVIRQRAE